ncbi:hypothetical protein V6C20_00920, partial [Caldibacillus thermoamylovorans]
GGECLSEQTDLIPLSAFNRGFQYIRLREPNFYIITLISEEPNLSSVPCNIDSNFTFYFSRLSGKEY